MRLVPGEAGYVQTAPNPILPGYHPDPTICRVGDTYYLVTSTCEYLPGLPVYASTDLVNWCQIGSAITRDAQLDLSAAASSLGLFAPTLRHHDGLFLLTSTLVGRGHFLVTARDPAGPWSQPVWIEGEGWDPSLVFDEGRAWFHYTTGWAIRAFEMDLATGGRIGPEVELWRGTGGNAPEGPHLYAVDGWWYLLIAEGGTAAGHAVTVARSRLLLGPYESFDGNPVLTHRGIDSPIQAVGHADLVQAPDGSYWAVLLGTRPLGGHGYQLLGRETFLVPVEWKDGWPVLGVDGRVPALTGIPVPVASCSFADTLSLPSLGRDGWLALRTAEPKFLTYTDQGLLLHGGPQTLDDVGSPTFLGRRQTAHTETVQVTLDADPEHDEEAGLAIRKDERHHYRMVVLRRASRTVVAVIARIGDLVQTVACVPADGPVELRISSTPVAEPGPIGGSGRYDFLIRSPGQTDWARLASLDSRYLSTDVAAGFTGTVIGVYATGSGRPAHRPVRFAGWQSTKGTQE